MRTSGSIRTEPDRTEIRTTIRVEYSLISHPMRCRIMVEISISAPIITHMVKVWTIMCSTISTVMVRHTKIKQTAIRVININPETPFPSGYIDWPIEILGTDTVHHSISSEDRHYGYPTLHNNHPMPIRNHVLRNP